MRQGALSKPVVQWWLSLNSSTPQRGIEARETTHDKRRVNPRATTALSWGISTSGHSQHAKQNSSFLKSDVESTREFGQLQDSPLYSHYERPTAGRPRVDPRCGSTQGRPRRSVGGCRPRAIHKHAKQNRSFLKSDLESTREFGRLQDGPFHSHSERPAAGRPRVDPRSIWLVGRLFRVAPGAASDTPIG